MPRIREVEPDFAKLGRLIRGYELNGVELGRVLGISAPTAMKKLRNPEYFTLGEIKKLSQRGHIPIDEIRECIQL